MNMQPHASNKNQKKIERTIKAAKKTQEHKKIKIIAFCSKNFKKWYKKSGVEWKWEQKQIILH